MVLKGVPLRVRVTETFFSTSNFCHTERECVETTVFMQDDASSHISRPVQALFQAHFGHDRGFLKDYIYGGKIRAPPELKASITRHVSAIDRETLRATVEYVITRLEYVLDADGMRIEHMLLLN
ncbi:hypothetical protein AVEN_45231-1 [Araneus ventricosus]|uniref:Uncharacterized protein n=1 Tax=Araneus ventricosus TaxID=182803 RepID=A0A4Y2V891_ARAVE|nr:hypothetical protein AVEN_45231-1 [Araneus ventricosus]